MIWLSTSGFVLALVAVAFAVAAWITSLINARTSASWRSTMTLDFEKRYANVIETQRATLASLRELEAKTPTKLAAEVAELSDAVAKQADIHRRFAGRVWQRIGANAPQSDGFEVTGDGAADDELTALLRLQSSPNAAPGAPGRG